VKVAIVARKARGNAPASAPGAAPIAVLATTEDRIHATGSSGSNPSSSRRSARIETMRPRLEGHPDSDGVVILDAISAVPGSFAVVSATYDG
jgi:hypothetical protein